MSIKSRSISFPVVSISTPKPILTIFYQFNPWHSSIGGIQTLIRSFIKYAPDRFIIQLVGTESDPSQPVGVWRDAELEGRAIRFLPLFRLENDNRRKRIPTTLRYAAALRGHSLASDFMHFHRLEPTLAARNWQGDKTLFVHNDIQEQIQGKGDKGTILWRHFPRGYFAIERLLVSQFDRILSCNTESVRYYQQRYPHLADRVSYIRNSVDNQVFYPLTPEERDRGRRILAQRMGLGTDTRFVLFAGRLHAQKDPLLLVRAMAALDDPETHLILAGDGDLQEEILAAIGTLHLNGRVTLLGAVPQAELALLMRVCSVFALTSAYEGLPLVALEALACGTPVVTTRCGETPNLLYPNSGIVCQERTPESVAAALRQVLLHPDAYPSQACLDTAQPYSVGSIVGIVYGEMWERWQQRQHRLRQQTHPTTATEVAS
jgi:glycosyltransferase involved in cell wall biosynthesis